MLFFGCNTVCLQDADLVGAEYLGHASIPVTRILDGRIYDDWLPLTDQQGKPVGHTDKLSRDFEQAAVRLTIRFEPVVPEVRAHLSLSQGC